MQADTLERTEKGPRGPLVLLRDASRRDQERTDRRRDGGRLVARVGVERGASRASRRGGFTLLELMVTMSLAAMLLGLGASMFMSLGKRSADQQAFAGVAQLLVRARNASNRFPATIVADPSQGQILAYTDEVLQELHFDRRPPGPGQTAADVVDPVTIRGCTLAGGVLEDTAGRVGGAAKLAGGSIDCGNSAIYDVDQGISVEAWIKPSSDTLKCDVVSRGRVFRVTVDSSARGVAHVGVKLSLRAPDGRQEPYEKNVEIPRIRANEWVGIRAAFDRREVSIATNSGYGWATRFVNAFDKDEDRARTLALDPSANLIVGAGLSGWIDDVRIGGIRGAEPVRLPEGMSVLPGRPIRFVGGRLDGTLHPAPEAIVLRSPGLTTRYVVGTDGLLLLVEDIPDPVAADAQSVDGQKR